jgi:hypothetical protein
VICILADYDNETRRKMNLTFHSDVKSAVGGGGWGHVHDTVSVI